jgi:hypothetical protein
MTSRNRRSDFSGQKTAPKGIIKAEGGDLRPEGAEIWKVAGGKRKN